MLANIYEDGKGVPEGTKDLLVFMHRLCTLNYIPTCILCKRYIVHNIGLIYKVVCTINFCKLSYIIMNHLINTLHDIFE